MMLMSRSLAVRGLWILLCGGLTACGSLPLTQGSDPPELIPTRHFVADWNASGAYQLSPDGQWLMWAARLGLGQGLFVKNLQTGQVQEHKIEAVGQWARDSRHILLHLQRNGDENAQLWALDVLKPDLPARNLTPFPGARSFLLRTLPRSDDLIIQSNRRDRKVFDLYRFDFATGDLRLLATNPADVAGWLVDDAGDLVARVRRDGQASQVHTRDATGQWQSAFRISLQDTLHFQRSSDKPGHWWALSNRERDKLALVELNMRDGAERVVHADARVDISQVLWSPRSRLPLAVRVEPDVQRWQAWDPAWQQALDQLRGVSPARVSILSISDDERWMVASVLRQDSGEHVLYDMQKHTWVTLAQLARSRWQTKSPLAAPQPRVFQSRDGLDLHGYLSLPVGQAHPHPAVVYVHGGPWARDHHLDGDAMPIFLANRGYAVLQVNYRGSSGYGKAFMEAARGEFAGKMNSDLSDALDALVAQGLIDPKRVAIAGGSYGGYASLVGMTHTPGRYQCAISTVGPTDLPDLLERMPAYWEFEKHRWFDLLGNPSDPAQRADMQRRSPLPLAHQVQGPVLLMHGVHDPRVSVSQAVRMAEALRLHGKPVELVLFDKAGHSLQRWQDRLLEFRKTEDFLARCLGGRSAGFDFFELGARLF